MKKNLLSIGCAVLLSFLCGNVFAQDTSWDQFDLKKLVSMVNENKITLIDDLFQVIPKEMKKNTLLVYDSKALFPELATLSTPRMVFFNKDGSLIFSISRNPGKKKIALGKDKLEVIAFNSVTGQFEMYAEPFNGKDLPFQNLAANKNPSRCLSCHGINPRPLFHNYNGWPGIYGSFGTFGVAAKDSREQLGLKAFISNAHQMARYKHLDLSGYYEYPAKDIKNKEGTVVTKAGSVGTAFGISDLNRLESIPFEVMNDYKFATPLYLGMNLESLMMKRLAMKLNSRNDFETSLLPLLYYLGDEDPTAFEKVESRCGHPNERTKKAFAELVSLNSNNQDVLDSVVAKIKKQIEFDSPARKAAVEKSNVLLTSIDHRGIADIPTTAYFPNLAVNNKSPDQETHKKMNALMEILFQKLELVTADVSTMKDTPTTGIFHLSRLGRMPVDEQFFQNFMRGLRWANESQIKAYDQLSCEEVEQKGLEAVRNIFGTEALSLNQRGVLYTN